ncbi:MAG TPA: DinB family protein [Longimicrobiaceae bacterium]|nr:DinB family protein [Longimicrobiaceae bacterium]
MRAHLERLFAHAAWADRRVLELLAATPGARTQRVLRLLAHLLAAERVWLLRLRGEDSAVQPIWPEDPSLDELRVLQAANEDGYARYLAALGDADLAAEVAYSNSRGEAFRTAVADVLAHVALHGSYHRGQVAAAVRGAGGEPVNTDFITFVREGR